MRRFTKISLSTLNHHGFSLKNEQNYRITDVFKKTDKLPVLLNYTSMVIYSFIDKATSNMY